uniref:Ribonuclease H-like domain-containing protein n=1 Tax=Tanacetum cinerariifolium TaxID=118510 RepID=A0A6L2P6I6_TANCI|nr:ribonuclease H-like domain-containing protein [Tanacetum cinerariifolium]
MSGRGYDNHLHELLVKILQQLDNMNIQGSLAYNDIVGTNKGNIDDLLLKLLEHVVLSGNSAPPNGTNKNTITPSHVSHPGQQPQAPYGYQYALSAHQAQSVVYPVAQIAQQAQTGPTAVTLGSVGPTAAPRQETTFPHGFTARTLHDPASGAWNMDTEKPSALCVACQVGKHVRLPFASSDIMVTSCFDAIHSDVWTSPIPSLSVPRPPDTNIVCCMWLFRHKYLANGMLSRYDARLVANGNTQLEGVDVDETFSTVVKSGTIRTVLSLTASRHWSIHQLDVKNAFLHGDLLETVYMHQPHGFQDSVHPLWAKTAPELCFSGLRLILLGAHMGNYNPSWTLIDTEAKLESDGDPHQPTLSHSIIEAECPGVANVVAETRWLRNLLRELHTLLTSATLVYCDNVSAVYLSCNPVQHQRTKHIEIDIHFVRDLVAAGQVRFLPVPPRYQFADVFTKEPPSTLFKEFCSSLCVRSPPAQTAREC